MHGSLFFEFLFCFRRFIHRCSGLCLVLGVGGQQSAQSSNSSVTIVAVCATTMSPRLVSVVRATDARRRRHELGTVASMWNTTKLARSGEKGA